MIIFNEAQTLGYSTNLNYLGNAFNYNNSAKISIKGKMISDQTFDGQAETFFGMTYVNESGSWIPLSGSGAITTGEAPAYSGKISFENGNAFISIGEDGYFYEGGGGLVYNNVPLLYNGNPLSYNFDGYTANGFSEFFVDGKYSPLYDIWAEMENIKGRFQDFQEIILNGVSIGSGRIVRISFPESANVQSATYETEIELYREGNLSNLTGENFNSITINNSFCKYVSSVDESFDLTTDKDGVINYKRSLNFDCINPNISDNSFVQGVKDFASGIFYGDPAFKASIGQYPTFYQNEGSRYFSESYDDIRGAYSFSEIFQGPTQDEKYRWTNTLSASFGGEGIATISEKGNIVGVRKNIVNSAYEGMSEVLAGAKNRAKDFLAFYGDSCPDNLFLVKQSKVINTEAGKIDYSLDYSNDPYSNGCYQVSQEITFSKAENGISTIGEKGSVKNTCEISGAQQLTKAIEYFKSNIEPEIKPRIFDYYSSNVAGYLCSGTPTIDSLRQITLGNTYSEYEGLLNYDYVYRDDYNTLINGCFLREVQTNTVNTIHNVNLAITPYSGEIAQKLNTSTLVENQQTITVTSQCKNKPMSDYLAIAYAGITKPTSSTFFMSGSEYQFDPDNSKFTLTVGYNYTGYRSYTNYNV